MADEVKVTVRLPAEIHSQVSDVARLDQRSLNSELIVLLREALDARKITVLEVKKHGR